MNWHHEQVEIMFYNGLIGGLKPRPLRAVCDAMHADLERSGRAAAKRDAPKYGKAVLAEIQKFEPGFKG